MLWTFSLLVYYKHSCFTYFEKNPTKLSPRGNCKLTSDRTVRTNKIFCKLYAYVEGTFKECVTWIRKDIFLELSLKWLGHLFWPRLPKLELLSSTAGSPIATVNKWICHPKVKKNQMFPLLFYVLMAGQDHVWTAPVKLRFRNWDLISLVNEVIWFRAISRFRLNFSIWPSTFIELPPN